MATMKGSTRQKSAGKSTTRSTATKATPKAKASAGRKYSPEASSYVEEEVKEMKEGKLKSGKSGETVRNPKQAIAIGLSEARKAGKRVPENPRDKAA